jgi:hypothetical protein
VDQYLLLPRRSKQESYRKEALLRGVFALVLSLSTPILLLASQNSQAEIAARAKGAERIVVGKVADVHASFGTNSHGDQLILSQVEVEVLEVLKGSPADVVTVEVEGGTVGDLTLRVSDMPELKAGERAVFFLEGEATGRSKPHGRGHGILKLDRDDRVPGSQLTLDAVKALVARVVR